MKLVSITIAALLAVGLAGSALAQEEAPAGGATSTADHAAHHPRSAKRGAAPAGGMEAMEKMHEQMRGMGLSGAHHMTGTITSINHRTGIIGFKTPEGAQRIYFPPSSIRRLKTGDTITLHAAYERGKGTHGHMDGMQSGQMGQGMGGPVDMHNGGMREQGMGGQGAASGGDTGSR